MTLQNYIKLAEDLPDPDKFTHGNRIMVELTFDQIRTIRNLPTMVKALIEAEEHIERLIRACDDHGVSETYTYKSAQFLKQIQALNGGEDDAGI